MFNLSMQATTVNNNDSPGILGGAAPFNNGVSSQGFDLKNLSMTGSKFYSS